MKKAINRVGVNKDKVQNHVCTFTVYERFLADSLLS